MAFKICNSVRLNAESHSDNTSITKVMERLDIATMLKRASMGILDLSAYAAPRGADVAGTSARKGEEIDALLDQPSTVMDNLFGSDRETAAQQKRQFEEIAERSRTPKEPEEPTPVETKKEPTTEETKKE